MPITLVTGLPGSGKTLRTITKVKERAESEGRAVYYHGIPELKLPWIPLDEPAKWFDVPDGSIVVIDECQGTFPLRGSSSAVPLKCSKFETHRHYGLDIYLLTQDQGLLDAHVRKLCGPFIHLQRPLGHDRTNVWEFPECCNPDSKASQEGGIKSIFLYPKKSFDYYKSSSVHTIKKRYPFKMIILPFLIFGVIALFWMVYHRLSHNDQVTIMPAGSVPAALPGTVLPPAHLSPVQYVDQFRPLVLDAPQSAPVYEKLAQAIDFPRIELCAIDEDVCRCYDQQGNRLRNVTDLYCRNFVNDGYFNPYASPPPAVAAPVLAGRQAPPTAVTAPRPGLPGAF